MRLDTALEVLQIEAARLEDLIQKAHESATVHREAAERYQAQADKIKATQNELLEGIEKVKELANKRKETQ